MLPSGRHTLLLVSVSFIIIFGYLYLANGTERYYANGPSLTADQSYPMKSHSDTGKSDMIIFYDGFQATVGYVENGAELTAKLNQDSLNDESKSHL